MGIMEILVKGDALVIYFAQVWQFRDPSTECGNAGVLMIVSASVVEHQATAVLFRNNAPDENLREAPPAGHYTGRKI